MVSGHDEDSQLARALGGGKPYPTGWFRLYFEDERWEWSPEVERLHGYEPGTAKPTTSMVLSETLWFRWRLGLLDFDQGLVGPFRSVEDGFELCGR
jgi:hypothetical protein